MDNNHSNFPDEKMPFETVKEFLMKKIALVPLALILVIVLSIYIPSLFPITGYDFAYSTCLKKIGATSTQCRRDPFADYFSVVDNQLRVTKVDFYTTPLEKYEFKFFLHDTKMNKSKEISLDEIKTLKLSDFFLSPDGVGFYQNLERSGHGLLNDSLPNFPSSGGYYLLDMSKRNRGRKQNLIITSGVYHSNGDFHFIGWVLPHQN